MDAGIKVEVDDSIQAFRAYSIRAESLVEKAVLRGALLVERTAKEIFKGRNDPSVYNEPPRVQTGRLRASITHRGIRENGVYNQEVGTNVEYAFDVEHGTSVTMPHPFMSYALGMHEHDINEDIARAVNEAAANA